MCHLRTHKTIEQCFFLWSVPVGDDASGRFFSLAAFRKCDKLLGENVRFELKQMDFLARKKFEMNLFFFKFVD